VQISATPKANRHTDVFGKSQRPSLSKMEDEMELLAVPPSSLPRIPQSIVRFAGEGAARNSLISLIQATPSRRSDPTAPKPNNRGLSTCGLNSSPIQPRCPTPQLLVPDSALKALSNPFSSQEIQETPVKRRQELVGAYINAEAFAPSGNKENSKAGGIGTNKNPVALQDSIYTSLGWDDADDIDDLA
jgi:DNA replication regulator SLD3